jgi:hypothetical protein
MNKATSLEIGAFDSGHVFNKNFGKKIQIQDSAELETLLDAAAYQEMIG